MEWLRDKKLLLGVGLLFLAIIALLIFLLAVQSKLPAWPRGAFEILKVGDSASAQDWAQAAAVQFNGQASSHEGVPAVKLKDGNVVLVVDEKEFGNALFRARFSEHNANGKFFIALVYPNSVSPDALTRIAIYKKWGEQFKIETILLTNSAAIAGAWLGSVAVADGPIPLCVWLLVYILSAGSIGGFFYSMCHEQSYSVILPFSGGKSVLQLGPFGHMLVGAGAGLALVALSTKAVGLDMEPLFSSPYQAKELETLIQLLVTSVVGGYLGIGLIKRMSEEQVNERFKKQDERLRSYERELKEAEEQNKKIAAGNLALSAKSIFNINYAAISKGEGLPEVYDQIFQIANQSLLIRPNALAYALIAEIKKYKDADFIEAANLYDKAIPLLPQETHIKKPSNIYFNRACVNSLSKRPEKIAEIRNDLEKYLELDPTGKQSIEADSELQWFRDQAAYRE